MIPKTSFFLALSALNFMILIKRIFFLTFAFCHSDLYHKYYKSILSSFVLSCVRESSFINKNEGFPT